MEKKDWQDNKHKVDCVASDNDHVFYVDSYSNAIESISHDMTKQVCETIIINSNTIYILWIYILMRLQSSFLQRKTRKENISRL